MLPELCAPSFSVVAMPVFSTFGSFLRMNGDGCLMRWEPRSSVFTELAA